MTDLVLLLSVVLSSSPPRDGGNLECDYGKFRRFKCDRFGFDVHNWKDSQRQGDHDTKQLKGQTIREGTAYPRGGKRTAQLRHAAAAHVYELAGGAFGCHYGFGCQ